MADQPAQGKQGKDGKILGMPRTTGIIVLGLAAVAVGYFVVSRLGKGGAGGGSGGGSGGGGGGGSGHRTVVEIIREWQGHRPRQPHTSPGGRA